MECSTSAKPYFEAAANSETDTEKKVEHFLSKMTSDFMDKLLENLEGTDLAHEERAMLEDISIRVAGDYIKLNPATTLRPSTIALSSLYVVQLGLGYDLRQSRLAHAMARAKGRVSHHYGEFPQRVNVYVYGDQTRVLEDTCWANFRYDEILRSIGVDYRDYVRKGSWRNLAPEELCRRKTYQKGDLRNDTKALQARIREVLIDRYGANHCCPMPAEKSSSSS